MAAISMLRLSHNHGFLYVNAVARDVPGRNISRKKLLTQLNLPIRPKKPPTAFALFFKEMKGNLKNEESGSHCTDLIKKSAQLWKDLSPDEKEKYQNKFKALRDEYSKEMQKFEGKLTEQQKMQLETFGVHYKNMKEMHATEVMRREKEKKLNKPKHPVPCFIQFVLDMKFEGSSANEAWKLAKEKWNELSEGAKEKYRSKFREDLEQYKKDLRFWEMEMIRKGHTDIVRPKTLKSHVLK